MFPHTVTLYNKYVDAGVEKWKRTVLEGVFFDGLKGATMRRTGVVSADAMVLLIPKTVNAGEYLKPKAWAAAEVKSGRWALQAGDIIVLGRCTQEVVKSASELRQLDDVYTITNADERALGTGMDHWEVTGK